MNVDFCGLAGLNWIWDCMSHQGTGANNELADSTVTCDLHKQQQKYNNYWA